jgi:hypothetical protein
MIGLGVLATGSGATALTGATLQNTVSPTADFRVNVDTADLVVKRGQNFAIDGATVAAADAGDITTDVPYIDDPADSGLDGQTGFAAAANTLTNGDLNFGVMIPFDKIPTDGSAAVSTSVNGDKTYTFPDLLQIDNKDTEGSKDVVISYADDPSGTVEMNDDHGYVISTTDAGVDGTTVNTPGLVNATPDSGGDLSFDEVANIFEFSVTEDGGSGQRVSPLGSATNAGNDNQKPNKAFEIEAASGTPTSVGVDLNLNLTPTLGNEIAQFISDQELIASGGTFRLVDSIYVSETTNPNSDTESGSAAFTAETI